MGWLPNLKAFQRQADPGDRQTPPANLPDLTFLKYPISDGKSSEFQKKHRP
jgi:hypothetical protein